YDDCKRGQNARGAMSLTSAPFTPPAGFEAPYKLGWAKASQEVIAAAEKAGRRGEGWGEIKIGGALFLGGVAFTVVSIVSSTGGSFQLWVGAIAVGLILIGDGLRRALSKQDPD